MNLRQLRCLTICSESRDLIAASGRLSMSPSAVIRQLKSLEDELGVELIYLRARPLSLSLRGEALARESQHILSLARQGVETLRRDQHKLVGTIRIALSLSSGHRLVYEILKDFASIAPEVRLDIRDVSFPSQMPQIQRGEIDIALLFPAWSAPGVCHEILLNEQLTVVLPTNHRFARRSLLRLQDLSQERWLVFYRPNSGRVGIDFYQACKRAGFEPIVAAEVQSQLLRMAHVVRGDGITVLACSYDPGIRRGLRRVPLHPDDLHMPAAIMWKEHDDRQIVDIFLKSVRRTIRRIYIEGAIPLAGTDFDIFSLPVSEHEPQSKLPVLGVSA